MLLLYMCLTMVHSHAYIHTTTGLPTQTMFYTSSFCFIYNACDCEYKLALVWGTLFTYVPSFRLHTLILCMCVSHVHMKVESYFVSLVMQHIICIPLLHRNVWLSWLKCQQVYMEMWSVWRFFITSVTLPLYNSRSLSKFTQVANTLSICYY